MEQEEETIICKIHGEQPAAYLDCTSLFCDEGFVDESEFDCINFAPGSYTPCDECKGKGAHKVCPECCAHEEDLRI